MTPESLLLAAGPGGLRLTPPGGVTVAPVANPVQDGAASSGLEQRARVEAALANPQGMGALKDIARERRRVAVVVGGLPLPAPYEIALPPLAAALVEAGIRPTRIGFLAFPGRNGAVLGRAAIQRYGEEIVGEHELRTWQSSALGEADPTYAAADLRIAVVPQLSGAPWPGELPSAPRPDCVLELTLGRRAALEIVSARCAGWESAAPPRALQSAADVAETDVLLCGGGGDPWDGTLEEALLSIHYVLAGGIPARTLVLAFSGISGLGSARFTMDFWNLLRQADEILASGGNLSGAVLPEVYDPAASVACLLRQNRNLVLFSPGLAEHSDGSDWAETLAPWPQAARRVRCCGSEGQLWKLLSEIEGEQYRLTAVPLGWRAWI